MTDDELQTPQRNLRGINSITTKDGTNIFYKDWDFDDLPLLDVPVLIMRGDDDPIGRSTTRRCSAAKLVKNAALKVYPGLLLLPLDWPLSRVAPAMACGSLMAAVALGQMQMSTATSAASTVRA